MLASGGFRPDFKGFRAFPPTQMDTESSSPLHLPSLKITGLRGFDRLTIPRLGRVTLLAGRNGVGKTTVLDAVRVLAARGRPSVLADLLEEREEFATDLNKSGEPLTIMDVAALFHGRGEARGNGLAIGPGPEDDDLRLARSSPDEWTDEQKPFHIDGEALKVEYGEWKGYVPWSLMAGSSSKYASPHGSFVDSLLGTRRFDEADWPAAVNCESLGPGLPDNNRLAILWNRIHLTDAEDFLVRTMSRHLDQEVQRMGVVNDVGGAPGSLSKRGVFVKLQGHPRPVPLKSFGDGAVRLFGVALELTHSRKGLLLIDEAENGLHHTVQADFWRLVLQAAHDGDVQVLATTHSWDCIVGFARAATECEHTDGVLVRLEPGDDGCRAVVYSEEELAVAADRRIEVR